MNKSQGLWDGGNRKTFIIRLSNVFFGVGGNFEMAWGLLWLCVLV